MGDNESFYASQALTSSALSMSVTPDGPRLIKAVLLHASAAITETLKVTIDSGNGSTYDTVIKAISLSAETDAAWFPEGDVVVLDGDAVLVTCTNANTTGTVYATLILEKYAGR